jgi:Na+/H+-translocating membrane pyrophosphatase
MFNWTMDLTEITVVMLCFGMGASSQALFARVGGGIYTKAADVGADLVGKVEAGIPEDDRRNPATIADNVGDNVGDVAGMGADLYESYCGSILSSAALGVAAYASMGMGAETQMRALFLPVLLAAVGIVLSIYGVFLVRTDEKADQGTLLKALGKGVNMPSIIIAILSILISAALLPGTADDLAGFLVADGGDGTGVDDVGVGRAVKGHKGMAPGGKQLLQRLGLVLIYLAAQGVQGDFHALAAPCSATTA